MKDVVPRIASLILVHFILLCKCEISDIKKQCFQNYNATLSLRIKSQLVGGLIESWAFFTLLFFTSLRCLHLEGNWNFLNITHILEAHSISFPCHPSPRKIKCNEMTSKYSFFILLTQKVDSSLHSVEVRWTKRRLFGTTTLRGREEFNDRNGVVMCRGN